MKKPFKELLESQNILPYTNSDWNTLCVNHTDVSNPIEQRNKIYTELKDTGCGIYIYTNKNNDVLYIGEGILKDRLYRHYQKSYAKQGNGSPRHQFFQMHKEELVVFYREIPQKYERLAIEAMLIVVLEAKYNQWLHKIK